MPQVDDLFTLVLVTILLGGICGATFATCNVYGSHTDNAAQIPTPVNVTGTTSTASVLAASPSIHVDPGYQAWFSPDFPRPPAE